LRKKKQRGNKEGIKDGEYLITYTRHLEKRLRNLETENHLLASEVLRLKQELTSLRKEGDGKRNIEARNTQDTNSKDSKLHENVRGNEKKIQKPNNVLLKWYELHPRKDDQTTDTSRQFEGQENNESEKIFKIVVLGIPEKTIFIRKYVTGIFTEDIKMTMGADFSVKKVVVDDIPITLRIWDVVSEGRFKFVLPQYIIGTNGVIIMCDVIGTHGFKGLSEYINVIRDKAGDVPIFLAIPGLPCKAEMRVNPIKKYKLTEITSEIGVNGERAFEMLTKKILEKNLF
jgi:hypothetical protein